MTPQLFLLILRARYKVALLVLIVTVLTTYVVSIRLPKQYVASTSVLIDVKSPDPVAGVVLPGLIAPSYMATQLDIINSDRVALRVVKLLRLEESPAIRTQWMEATNGKGKLDLWLAALLQRKLEVKPSKESNVISIGFSGTEPSFVAAVANTFAQAYIDVSLELKVEPARQYSSWFEGQSKTLRDQLEKAQGALTLYQEKNNVLAMDEQRVDYEKSKLSELSQALTTVQAQTSDSSSKRQSTSDSGTLSDVMQSPVIMSLKSDINRLEAKLQESNVNLGKNHPQTQRAESELASLKEKLAGETKQISRSINTSFQVGRQREKELLQAIESQKKRVIDLSKERDEITVLRRDVETAQHAFDAISMKFVQTKMESQTVQTNVAVLTPAAEPTGPSKPNIFINVVASVVLGTMLGLGIAFMLELVNRRVRSAEDLTAITNLPVLASIASIAAPPRWRDLFTFLSKRGRRANAVPA
ncbi:MAG: chain length determinant protein EpsF [Rhodoferax sp.]|nr:chain length determinant protein EpsF [Rhodoferax sp.]